MKLAISNLAWNSADDLAVAALLQSLRIDGVELAPTKVWNDPLAVTSSEADDYRQMWASFGIEVVAIQSLLFGRPDLQLFDTAEARARTFDHLAGMTRLAERLGARAIVFGSPKNRIKGALSGSTAATIAVPFFRALAAQAAANGAVFCLEPNPVRYGCDWIVTTSEALALSKAIDHEGFGLNVDTAGITLSGENPTTALAECASAIGHFHISEIDLAPIGSGGVDHDRMATALAQTPYSGWMSVEMREPRLGGKDTVAPSLATARFHYRRDRQVDGQAV